MKENRDKVNSKKFEANFEKGLNLEELKLWEKMKQKLKSFKPVSEGGSKDITMALLA